MREFVPAKATEGKLFIRKIRYSWSKGTKSPPSQILPTAKLSDHRPNKVIAIKIKEVVMPMHRSKRSSKISMPITTF